MAMLPGRTGVALAMVLHLVLHNVASQHVVTAAQPGQVGAMVTQTLWKTLASGAVHLLPPPGDGNRGSGADSGVDLVLTKAGLSDWMNVTEN